MKQRFFCVVWAFVFLHGAYGINTQISSMLDRYFRVMELSGEARNRALAFTTLTSNDWHLTTRLHPWNGWISTEPAEDPSIELLSQRTFLSFNSYYPSGGNDFEVWQGAGVNAWADGGLRITHDDWLSVTVAPRISVSQNASYPTLPPANPSEHSYFVSQIDWPQRFGSDPYFQVSPGESEIRFTHRSLSAGFGTQSIWLGPARFNPLIMGNNAGGFPHVDLGLAPTQTRVGTFEAAVVWGMLSESEYFDDVAGNDHRFTALLSLAYSPNRIPGFSLSVHRFVQSPWADVNIGSLLDPFTSLMSTALGRDNKDQRASATAKWQFPAVGFETYFEWARNDYSHNWRAIVQAPEHSNAYTIGVQKLIPTQRANDRLLLFGELTQLILSRDYYIDLGVVRGGFYHHSVNIQGHTHNGQILAAPIGTGSDSQTIGLDWFVPRGMIGARITRTSRNKDYIYGAPDADRGDVTLLNVEMLYEVSGALWIAPGLLMETAVSFANNINWQYEQENDVQNVRLFVGLTYRP